MSITAIIVNYHTASFLSDLLDDLVDHTAVESVYIIDNSGEIYKYPSISERKKVTILIPDSNIGFGAGVNLAASKIKSEYILLVNPDIRLLPGCIDNLISAALENSAVLVGPRFFWDNEKKFRLPPSQGASSWFDFALSSSKINRLDAEHISFYWQIRHERFWEKKEPFIEPFLSGSVVLIDRKWVFRNSEFVFDKRFFLYYEDTDLATRAVFDGFPPLCVPSAEAIHYYDQSPDPESGKANLMANAYDKFKEKYFPKTDFSFNNQTEYHQEIEELGELQYPPEIDLADFCFNSNLFFEIGINRVFIPFAQTEIYHNNNLKKNENPCDSAFYGDYYIKYSPISEDLWKRQAQGVYYGRLRHSIKGTLKVWKWRKI